MSRFHKHPDPAWRGDLQKLPLLGSMRITQLGLAPLINTLLRKSFSTGLCILYRESEEAKGFKTVSYYFELL